MLLQHPFFSNSLSLPQAAGRGWWAISVPGDTVALLKPAAVLVRFVTSIFFYRNLIFRFHGNKERDIKLMNTLSAERHSTLRWEAGRQSILCEHDCLRVNKPVSANVVSLWGRQTLSSALRSIESQSLMINRMYKASMFWHRWWTKNSCHHGCCYLLPEPTTGFRTRSAVFFSRRHLSAWSVLDRILLQGEQELGALQELKQLHLIWEGRLGR